MLEQILISVLTAFIIAVPTGFGVYGALRKELEWHRSDITAAVNEGKLLHRRINDHVKDYHHAS